MAKIDHAEQRARDALEFDPFPSAKWLTVANDGIYITVNYSEPLSRLIKSLPSSRWDAARSRWRFPFVAADSIRANFDKIDSLAKVARACTQAETAARQEFDAAAEARRRQAYELKQQQLAAVRPRPMRPEFLRLGIGPKASLVLEAVAHNVAGFGPFNMPPRQWVRQIVGMSANSAWAAAYLSGATDYARANSRGSRGVMVTYQLDPGLIYQVKAPSSWKRSDMYFCRVEDGVIIKMIKDEVLSCLEK